MSTQPDYAKLSLHGDGMKQDSFSLALQAAARLLGRDADYDTIAAMTTSIFSPAINPAEDCMSWWHVDGYLSTAANLQPVADWLGLRVTRLDVPAFHDGGKNEENALQFRRAIGRLINRAVDAGSVVVVDGGWQATGGPHGFVPWGWAGIITQALPDGDLLGACLNGEKDNPIAEVSGVGMWAVSAGSFTVTPTEADLATLRQVVARIRGTGPFQRTSSSVYGLDAMDLWIKQMEEVPGFCGPCQRKSQRGWTDAMDNALAMSERARVAAAYLRRTSSDFADAARSHLESAAQHYDRIVQLLTPPLTGEGGEKYEQFVGDLTKQKAHAEAVLRPVKAELSGAADDLEKALASPSPGAVLVSGVPAGKGDGNEFARGLEVILNHAGTPVDYDTLMGDLGLAFIMQASDEVPRYGGALDVGWWPLDPACIPTYLDFVSRTVGRRVDSIGLQPASPAQLPRAYREKVQPRVEAALRSGRPFLANHDFWKVITGYDRGDPPLLGFCPCTTGTEPERLPGYAWSFAFLGESMPRMDRGTADLEALEHALVLARDEVPMPGGFVTGQKAFALWARTLRDGEHLGEARWHANSVGHLAINRASAVAYLRAMAARQREAASHLEAAADLYEQVLDKLKMANTSTAALMSRSGREDLAALVEEIARIEVRAVGEIEKAVAEMGPR